VGRRTNAVLSDAVFAAPARAMTRMQQRFVDAYLANGGKGTEAAAEAGYAIGSADTQASNLLRNPLVQQAIMRSTLTAIGLSAVPALMVVTKLMSAAKSDYVKLEAAKDLLDRAGLAAPQRVDHRLDSSLTVSFDLGGSKTDASAIVTPHNTGKSPPMLDLTPVDGGAGGQDTSFPWEAED